MKKKKRRQQRRQKNNFLAGAMVGAVAAYVIIEALKPGRQPIPVVVPPGPPVVLPQGNAAISRFIPRNDIFRLLPAVYANP